MIRWISALGLLALAACGVDGQPETPERGGPVTVEYGETDAS